MKRILILLVTIHLLAFSGFSQAQRSIVVGSPEYQSAKENGTLDQYDLVLDLHQATLNGAANSNLPALPPPSATNKSRDIECDCYVEPDNSYTTALNACDDCVMETAVALPFTFNFYGTPYNEIYINNNGNVTFGENLTTFSSTAFPSNNRRIVAPFWADVDTRGAGRVVYKIIGNAIYINWHNVGYFNNQNDKINNFQLILSDGIDPAIPDANNVAFCYGDMQWTTGSASQGTNGFGGTPATAGANKGDNSLYFLIGRFDHPGTDYDGALGANDGISWLDNKSFFFDISPQYNTPPIPQGISQCDTFKVCALGDSAAFSVIFLSPELDQETTITWDNGGLNELTEVVNATGNTAQLILSIVGTPQNVGEYNITVTATDNHPVYPETTTLIFVVQIVEDLNAVPLNPSIDVNMSCGQAVLNTTNGPYDTYLWSDGALTAGNTFTESGEVNVTVSRNKCYKMVSTTLHIPQPVVPAFQGVLGLCPNEDSTLVTLSNFNLMGTINWGPGNLEYNNTDSAYLRPGTHNIVTTDTSGLCTQVNAVVITQATPSTFPNFPIVKCAGETTHQVVGAIAGTGAVWSSPSSEINFNGTATSNVNNPLISTTAFGIYEVNLTTACGEPFSGQIIFSTTPDILINDTTVCGSSFQMPEGAVYTAGGGTWMNLDPNGISFDDNLQDLSPKITLSNNYPLPYTLTLRIYDRYCTEKFDQMLVTFVPSGVPNIPAVACDLNSWDLTVSSHDGGLWSVLDNPSTPWLEDTAYVFANGAEVEIPHMIVSTAGTYTVSYYDEFCDVTTTGDIYFVPYIWADIKDTLLCTGVTYTLIPDVSTQAINFAWNTGATSQSIEVNEPGMYELRISNECYTFIDTAFINYYMCDIQSPNVISLSSQVGNDKWFVDQQGIEKFECFIVNRWGNVVAELNDVNAFWNGTDLGGNQVSEGVYFYNIRAFSYGGLPVNKQGFITVVK